jgi:hypothetical protein
VRIEQRAAAAVLAAGGEVTYDWQMRPAAAEANYQLDPPGPNFLRTWFGPHWFDSIVEVELKGNRLPDLPLPSLAQVAEMPPAEVTVLAAARNLPELRLRNTQVFSSVLMELARLPRLEQLQIRCSGHDRQTGKRIVWFDLDDESAAVIGGFPRLREVLLIGTKITDRGVAELCKLSHLEVLDVGSDYITSASFGHLSRLKKLRHFGARFWQFKDGDIEKLQDAPQLTSLDLATPLLTNANVAEVCKLKQLKRLTLYGYEITDESLAHLRELPELEWLVLYNTSVDQYSSASREFANALPGCAILWPPRKTWSESFTLRRFGGEGGDWGLSVGGLVERGGAGWSRKYAEQAPPLNGGDVRCGVVVWGR